MTHLLLYLLLLGAPYSRVNCSQFVTFGHHEKTVAQLLADPKMAHPSTPRLGDVLVNQAHCGVYITRNWIMDSTPEHGVAIHRMPKLDPWYQNMTVLRY